MASYPGSIWSQGVALSVPSGSADTMQPLSLDGRGMMRLISGYNAAVYSPVVHIYYSELVSGVTSWSQQAILTPLDTTSNERFGYSAALYGDYAFVGAPGDGAITTAGSAYIFQGSWTKWSEQQKLIAEEDNLGAAFGYAVSIKKNVALVTSPYDDDHGTDSGSVYAFVTESSSHRKLTSPSNVPSIHWSQQQKLIPKIGAAGDFFGKSVVVDDGVAVIGATGTNSDTGSAYIYYFDENTLAWSQQQQLFVHEAVLGDQVGSFLAIYGKTIVVADHRESISGEKHLGAVYVFRPTTGAAANYFQYSQQQKIICPIAHPVTDYGAYFGNPIAFFDNTMLIGASGIDYSDGNTFVYTNSGGKTWSNSQILTNPDADGMQFSNAYIYGMSAFITDSIPKAYYFTADSGWKCLTVSLGDQFGDGWDKTSLIVTAPDESINSYSPYCDTRNPLQFRYCPTIPSDYGSYTFAVPNALDAKFFWEIYWTVTVEKTGKVYRGDHSTKMTFVFDKKTLSFDYQSAEHLQYNKTCSVCAPKPKPKPKPVPEIVVPVVPVPPVPEVVAPVVPVKTAPVASSVSTHGAVTDNYVRVASPKMFRSRQLLTTDTPSGAPSSGPSGGPSGSPTGPPSSHPSHIPTTYPTRWPTLNTSYYQDWHWLKLYDSAANGWYEINESGTSYYISDPDGKKLISTGSLCPGSFSHNCWQDLKEGTYLLRVGGGLDSDSGDHVWEFCGKTGGGQRELLFKIADNTCSVVASYSKNEICSTTTTPKISLKGQLLLVGLSEEIQLTAGDISVFKSMLSSIGTVFKSSDITIEEVTYSSTLSGHIIQFTTNIIGATLGYNIRDYEDMYTLEELVTTELTTAITDGDLVSNLYDASSIETSDSNTLKSVSSITLLSFYTNGIEFVPVQSTEISSSNSQSGTDGSSSDSTSEYEDSLLTPKSSASAIYASVGIAVALSMIFAFIFIVWNTHRNNKNKAYLYASASSTDTSIITNDNQGRGLMQKEGEENEIELFDSSTSRMLVFPRQVALDEDNEEVNNDEDKESHSMMEIKPRSSSFASPTSSSTRHGSTSTTSPNNSTVTPESFLDGMKQLIEDEDNSLRLITSTTSATDELMV